MLRPLGDFFCFCLWSLLVKIHLVKTIRRALIKCNLFYVLVLVHSLFWSIYLFSYLGCNFFRLSLVCYIYRCLSSKIFTFISK